MNPNSRANRAARRVRSAKNMLTVIRDELQEAEAELYIDGNIRNVDEANALINAGDTLNMFEESLVSLSMLLTTVNERDLNPQYTEFDDLTAIARTEGTFRSKG